MLKPKVQIIDTNMIGSARRIVEEPSCYWEWNAQDINYPVTVFTDSQLKRVSEFNSKVKIGVLLEPPIIDASIYRFVLENYEMFDEIITFDKSLLKIDKRFTFYPFGSTWIESANRKLWKKTKSVSMIASSKNYAPGHVLRHICAKLYSDKIDTMGGGYRAISSKNEGLLDYRYSITIENSKVDDYFTEKILDAIVVGTVPIFWGFKNICNYFDKKGIIQFDTEEELGSILDTLSIEDYHMRLPFIKSNMEEAKKYINVYENIWKACLYKYFEV